MAAPISEDRKLAAEVRRLTLGKIKKLLEMGIATMSDREVGLHDAILTKLAGSVLPRLNEITGEDGEVIRLSFDPSFKPNVTASETTGDNKESSEIQDS